MSAHLMIVAGYLDLPSTHKIALMKMSDSADDQNRLGFPGLEAIRVWTGKSKSRALGIIRELQELGLVMQVEAGHRGKRAVFRIFPSPGDEVFSLAAKQGRECPGKDLFKGVPGIPGPEEIAARVEALDTSETPEEGSHQQDPTAKGPADRTLTEGSHPQDPNPGEGSHPQDPNPRKGPIPEPKGSYSYRTPSVPNFSKSKSSTPATSSPAVGEAPSGTLFDNPAPPPPEPAPTPPPTEGQRVNRLARGYTDAVPLSNFPAVQGVVRKAVRARRGDAPAYAEEEIRDGLARLAADSRPVTTDTLRIAIEGLPPLASPARVSPQSARLAAARANGARLRAIEAQSLQPPAAAIEGTP
jgi:hypothetical protein